MVVHAAVQALRKLRQEDPKSKATLSQVRAAVSPVPWSQAPKETNIKRKNSLN